MNRNKLVENFIGNLSNAIVHEIFKRAVDDNTIRSRYLKELNTSMKTALEYRNKINPINSKLQGKDINYIKDNEMIKGENPPIGLILCADKDEAQVKYVLGGINNKVFASKYKLNLPSEKELKEELVRERKLIEMERGVK